jgi:hypothetical protein
LKRATPIAASIAIIDDTSTEISVTVRLLRRNVQYDMPAALPLITAL